MKFIILPSKMAPSKMAPNKVNKDNKPQVLMSEEKKGEHILF